MTVEEKLKRKDGKAELIRWQQQLIALLFVEIGARDKRIKRLEELNADLSREVDRCWNERISQGE